MSINAYRIRNNNLDIERASFDIGHDEKLIDLLNEEMLFYMSLNSCGTGIVDIPVELLEKVVDAPKKYDLDEDTVSQIKSDIESAKSNKDEVVTYYCF
jgi:hypothetical protein